MIADKFLMETRPLAGSTKVWFRDNDQEKQHAVVALRR